MYGKEKTVKSKIVKSLTAEKKMTMTTAPAAPHGGVASKNIDDSHIEKSRKKTKRETQKKWETEAKWSCLRARMENHKHK